MRYATDRHHDHPGVWVTCDLSTGRVLASHGVGERGKTRSYEALTRTSEWDAIVAAIEPGVLTPWVSDPGIAYVDVKTSDRRMLVGGGEAFRSFPLPLMAQVATSFGHDGAMIAGRIDKAFVQDGALVASGLLDSGEFGTEVARLVQNQILRGISIDLGDIDVESEVIEEDEDGWPIDWLDRFTVWEVMGATITPFPAFADARIRLTEDPAEDDEEDTPPPAEDTPVTDEVTASNIPTSPPVEWFDDPGFTSLSPIRVTDDGRVFGHIGGWGTCHVGIVGQCVTLEPNTYSYDFFRTGYVQCEDGCEIPTGVLTLGGGHAPRGLDIHAAKAHYDDVGLAVADLAIGEDAFGIWVAGAARPNITDEQFREMRAHPPSVDIRRYEGQMTFVGVAHVNRAGFPIPRSEVRVASGELQVLVASSAMMTRTVSGRLGHDRDLEARVTTLEAALKPLLPLAADQLSLRIR